MHFIYYSVGFYTMNSESSAEMLMCGSGGAAVETKRSISKVAQNDETYGAEQSKDAYEGKYDVVDENGPEREQVEHGLAEERRQRVIGDLLVVGKDPDVSYLTRKRRFCHPMVDGLKYKP